MTYEVWTCLTCGATLHADVAVAVPPCFSCGGHFVPPETAERVLAERVVMDRQRQVAADEPGYDANGSPAW